MADNCYVRGCMQPSKFICRCDSSLKICQAHLSSHLNQAGQHDISSIIPGVSPSQQRVTQAMLHLSDMNTRTLNEGKEMFQELCTKLCGFVDMFAKRQQCLVDLSSHNYSPEVDSKIRELEKIDIKFRKPEEFKQLLDRYLSGGPDMMDYAHFQEFKNDFRNIASEIQKNNEYLMLVAQKNEEAEKSKKKVEKKIKEHDKQLKELDKKFEMVNGSVERALKLASDTQKVIKLESKKIQGISHAGLNEFRSEKKVLENLVSSKVGNLNGKISQIEDGFKAKVEEILRRIEEEKKQMNDEIERKRTEAARIEEERKIQELNKIHPEKSKNEIRKS